MASGRREITTKDQGGKCEPAMPGRVASRGNRALIALVLVISEDYGAIYPINIFLLPAYAMSAGVAPLSRYPLVDSVEGLYTDPNTGKWTKLQLKVGIQK